MTIFELIKPGTYLDLPCDDGVNFKYEGYIDRLVDCFYEANICLNSFREEKEKSRSYYDSKEKLSVRPNLNIESEASIRNRIREAIEVIYKQTHPNGLNVNEHDLMCSEIELGVRREVYLQKEMSDFNRIELIRCEVVVEVKRKFINDFSHDRYTKIDENVGIEIKRKMWSQGEIPSTFKNKKIFVYAKSFLFSIDNFDKELDKLLKEPLLRDKVVLLKNSIRKIFPDLRGVRNSAHHFEDRIRGIGQNSKKIELRPIENNFIYAPNGGVMVLNGLNGDNYANTLSNGEFGQVEVSIESMKKLRDSFQTFLDSLRWGGSRKILPD